MNFIKATLAIIFLASVHYSNAQRYLTSSFEVSETENIQYGENTNYLGEIEQLFLDLYEPVNDTLDSRPLVIYAHGGGFIDQAQTKDLVHIDAYCDSLAARGYVVASIDYRLDTTICHRAVINAMHDMKAAVRFFKINAETYGVNPDQIMVAGESAGAVTSLNTSYVNEISEVIYPQTSPFSNDLSIEGASGNEGVSSGVKACLSFCGGTATSLGDEMFLPSHIQNSDDPSLVMVNGTDDTFIPIANALEVAIQAQNIGLPNLFYTLPGADHCPWFFPLENSWLYLDTLIDYSVPFMYASVTEFDNSVKEISSSHIELFPNPASGYLRIIGLNPNDKTYLLNSLGQDIGIKTETENVLISELNPGVYYILISHSEGTVSRNKFIKR